MKATHRYTFDAKLFAVIQVTAVDERQARKRLDRINGLPLDHHHGDELTITGVSVDGEADLIEADDADTPPNAGNGGQP